MFYFTRVNVKISLLRPKSLLRVLSLAWTSIPYLAGWLTDFYWQCVGVGDGLFFELPSGCWPMQRFLIPRDHSYPKRKEGGGEENHQVNTRWPKKDLVADSKNTRTINGHRGRQMLPIFPSHVKPWVSWGKESSAQRQNLLRSNDLRSPDHFFLTRGYSSLSRSGSLQRQPYQWLILWQKPWSMPLAFVILFTLYSFLSTDFGHPKLQIIWSWLFAFRSGCQVVKHQPQTCRIYPHRCVYVFRG
jgi:hypothetical protein